MSLIQLAIKSLLSRRLVSILLILSIGLSTLLLIGIDKIKQSTRQSFTHSVSGTDLVVGPRMGDIQLLLYSVFRIGNPIANMSWESVEKIKNHSAVSWVIPISLGDSHRGYPVLGTTKDYFKYFQYGKQRPLELKTGTFFSEPFDAVIGSVVATEKQYQIGDEIHLSHGTSSTKHAVHEHKHFKIVGILNKTRTPVDNTVHISLEGMEALHIDWKNGRPPKKHEVMHNHDVLEHDLHSDEVTACFVGLKTKMAIFSFQRELTTWSEDPIFGIIPGITLLKIWKMVGMVDQVLKIITILVLVVALIGLLLSLFISLNHRKRELIIIRVLGGHPIHLWLLMILEGFILSILGVLVGSASLAIIQTWFVPFIENKLGLVLTVNSLAISDFRVMGLIIIASVFISSIPAGIAYKKTLSQGLGATT
ncbi:peptide ABC transporter permease [Candidatus Marinamargulisbacteria bacterium SCGC AG-410-N11]|nr:peptide ABC transporter permease [Candidatus Marinamargulisbacteria bacterium SCGC AG-410-N11]